MRDVVLDRPRRLGRSKPPQDLGLLWSFQLDRVVPGVNLLGDVEITVADLEGWEGVSPHSSWACSGRFNSTVLFPVLTF